MRLALFPACGLLLLANIQPEPTAQSDMDKDSMRGEKELIIVAAPRTQDPYYAGVRKDIIAFHRGYGAAVQKGDDFLVLTDIDHYADYVAALGPESVVVAPQEDIWIRDFGLSNVTAPVLFHYTAEGQGGGRNGQSEADHVQSVFKALVKQAGLIFSVSQWRNDGGNYVDDYAGRIIISRKFLRDNSLTEATGRARILDETGARHVAFIDADTQGGLEHADGVVAFIAPNVVVLNRYPEDPDYAARLRADLEAGLPGVTLHELIAPYDGSETYDRRFEPACGLYTNMLVTPERIYLPQFGIREDSIALNSVRAWTEKEVIPVPAQGVCHLGGGLRCLSWQLRGDAAETFRTWALTQPRPKR